jgi:hypothetical protein
MGLDHIQLFSQANTDASPPRIYSTKRGFASPQPVRYEDGGTGSDYELPL